MDSSGVCVWVHAVSLGETRAAAALIDALRTCVPGMRLLLTHGTATGRAEGQRLLRPGDQQAWLPWDTPGAVGRFLKRFQPRVGVLMETEVWPNLVAACQRQGLPLVLANARLSDKSLNQALRWRSLSLPAYGSLGGVLAQSDADAVRLRALGAPVAGVFGNLKFDAQPDQALLDLGRRWRESLGRPVWLLASSREGEEADFLRCLEEMWPVASADAKKNATYNIANDRPWILIVPRHPQRFDEVQALIVKAGWRCERRSAWTDIGPAGGHASTTGLAQPAIGLGDSLGEMALYYGLADVALLGGSFAPLGGQNLIEAAACACPVVMGPHTFNFAEAAEQSAAAGAALRVGDWHAALQQAVAIARDPTARRRMSDAAAAFAATHRGSAQRQALAICELIPRAQSSRNPPL